MNMFRITGNSVTTTRGRGRHASPTSLIASVATVGLSAMLALGGATAARADDSPPATIVGESVITSFISPGRTAVAGDSATYGVTLRATKAGTAALTLVIDGMESVSDSSVPREWIRHGDLTGSAAHRLIWYNIPYLNEGDIVSLSLHFTVYSNDNLVKATLAGGPSTTEHVDVVPPAPACTGLKELMPAQSGAGATTTLEGVTCLAPAGTRLGEDATASHGEIVPLTDGKLAYRSYDATFTGPDTIYLFARDGRGDRSDSIPITVAVVPAATAVTDEYTVAPDTTLTMDARHGVMANDSLPFGRDGWSVESGYPPAHGALDVRADGALTFTPEPGYTGDVTFRYRLGGASGAHSNVVQAVIHITS
ncbi:Ig-like domain-containing protein [Subtercola frigoramans]|uniref:Uncharacterized protein n=1 Tax=Subtercola frigoramans TaxID=120298 RepID=A0ABS2L0B5_9MICO|nr:Ig-like domain-containing protein [Subtercola frigoramans]MBM7470518.1 hypothetical protein [Subtercola frigoramans]